MWVSGLAKTFCWGNLLVNSIVNFGRLSSNRFRLRKRVEITNLGASSPSENGYVRDRLTQQIEIDEIAQVFSGLQKIFITGV